MVEGKLLHKNIKCFFSKGLDKITRFKGLSLILNIYFKLHLGFMWTETG